MADQGESVTFILPSGEKQEFLIPSGMSDAEAKTYVLSKRPDLFRGKEAPPTDPAMQAHQQMRNAIGVMANSNAASFPGARPNLSPFTEQGQRQAETGERYNDYQKQSGIFAGTAAGTMATGGVLPGIKNLPMLNKIISMGGRAGATGLGAGAGALAGGATPEEAKVTAEAGVLGQPIAEGISAIASPLVKWIGASKSLGAKMLQAASSKAGSAAVELSPETNAIIDDVVRQSKLGGKAPKVVSDLLERLGPSTKQAADAAPGPLTYDEARIVQGNLSTMSVNEINDLKGQLKYLMPKLARSFSQDVQAAADKAGVGSEHALGMQEYATASARNRFLKNLGKAAVGGTALYGGWRELQNLKK